LAVEALADLRPDQSIEACPGTGWQRDAPPRARRPSLKSAWETGSAAEVQAAMTAFLAKYLRDSLSHAPYARTQQTEFRTWSKQFAHRLFGTDHITVRYEISYDTVDIRKLSPGTRGIVLLLLYLALDDSDDRPLIIARGDRVATKRPSRERRGEYPTFSSAKLEDFKTDIVSSQSASRPGQGTTCELRRNQRRALVGNYNQRGINSFWI
jgi:hypothetical protein